jgi:hypothetical protein
MKRTGAGTKGSLRNRSPIIDKSSCSNRRLAQAISAGEASTARARRLDRAVNGSEGWERTGATMAASVIIARANPPVKHIPTAPTPLPSHSACAKAASARSQSTMGLERSVDQTWITADADGLEHRSQCIPGRDRSRPAKKAWTEDRHPGGRHPVREPRDQGMQAGHLMDDDDRRPGAAPKHRPRPPAVRIGEVESNVSRPASRHRPCAVPPRRLPTRAGACAGSCR